MTPSSPNTTGINPWWTYEEGALPGTGKYMANAGNGNLIVQSDDIDIPERGIDLAFRRTYNSGSLNDTNANSGNDDGSPNENVYGNGWTNTFDVHVANNTAGGISVFDIDGARYDYSPSGTGCLTPPPGMYNQLCTDGGNGWLWYKKSGTIYYFFGTTSSQANAGYSGRLYVIWPRNQDNRILLSYYWANGDASSSNNLTQIVAGHSDGQQLVLSFGMVNGRPLLSSITRPDGSQVTYSYSGDHDLTSVGKLGNGSTSVLTENYAYYAGDKIAWVRSPRWVASGGNDGAATWFYYDTSSRVNGIQLYGFANFAPGDGTGTVLQPNYGTGASTIAYSTLSYPSAGETSLTDTDGHATNWLYDASARVTQTQEFTGNGTLWLVTGASWDSSDNLTETVDARGYATDYAYDSNGNTIAVALPTVSTNQGTFRPTSLYSYDRTNGATNIAEYCDPVHTHAIGADWTANPGTSDALCPNQAGATRYTWDYSDSVAEPFGRLSNSYTPLGYHRTYSYSNAAQGGDFGLPSDVAGDAMTQSDGSVRSPHQSFTYDGFGNLTAYTTGLGSTTLSYDSVNRPTAVTDPDSVTSRTCYYANGQVQAKQSAAQYALDGNVTCGSNAVSFAYDADRDVITEVHHFGNQTGTTSKYYDGEDRLVEVAQPHDASDLYSFAWLTRYIYDLSHNNSVAVDGASFYAYGNLYKTEEYLPGNPVIAPNTTPSSPQWMEVRGTAFDALDRATAAYENAFGTTPKTTNTYDSNGNYGLLSQSQNAVGQQSILSYLSTAWTYQKQYQNDGGTTPSEIYAYDADGRATTIQSSQFGSENLAYDGDGRLLSDSEPTGGGYNSPATMSYGYYSDGLRQTLSVSSSVVSATNAFQYSYRTDGLLKTQHLTYPVTGDFAWTYSNAGRELTQNDPFTGIVIALSGTTNTRTLQAKTSTYDGYGRVSSLVLPQGYTYGTFTYDPEDETTGYVRTNAYCPIPSHCHPATRTQAYNVRGELTTVGDTVLSERSSHISADGTMVVPNGTTSQDGFDARSGMITSKLLTGYGINAPYAYDVAGRQTTVTDIYPYNAYPQYATRTYDAENHVVSQAYTGGTSFSCPTNGTLAMCGGWPGGSGNSGVVPSGVTNTYSWGPNGHPILLVGNYTNTAGAAETVSVHWDGDDILFALNQNNMLDFEVGKLGIGGYPTSFTIADRDMTGQEVSSHTATAFGSWDGAQPNGYCGACKGEGDFTIPNATDSTWESSDNDSYQAAMGYLSSVREDGYSDGFGNTFQGVRAYDGNLGQWTTPDAYAGDVQDPMSQKPYMWNHNNPLVYEDPSGYCPVCVGAAAVGGADALLWTVAAVAVAVGAGGTATWANNNRETINRTAGQVTSAIGSAVSNVATFSKKSIKKAIKSLGDVIAEHQGKIAKDPTSESADHWAGEIKAAQGNIDKQKNKLTKNKKAGKPWKEEVKNQ